MASLESQPPLLINLAGLGMAGIWYQWLAVVGALAYEVTHRHQRHVILRTDADIDQSVLRLTGTTLPHSSDSEHSGPGHPWKVASGARSYDAFKAMIPARRSIYQRIRIGDELHLAQAVIERIARPYTCVIIRGIPAERGRGAPLLCMDSTYYSRMVGEIDLPGFGHALNIPAWSDEARRNPVFVCGDAYEDTYADYLRTLGLEVYTKNRESLIRSGVDVNGLALIDYVLALESARLLGLCTSALYFVARETRLYLHNKAESWDYVLGQPTDFGSDRSFITPQEWAAQVVVCDVIERRYPTESFYANFQKGPGFVRELQQIAAKWRAEAEQV